MSTGKHFVIQKGKAMCNQGTSFPSFKVASHTKHYWNDSGNSADFLAVTEDDTQFTPSSNPFGACSLNRKNPCAYAPAGKWTKTYDKVKVLGKKCVVEDSELMCSVGGKITVLQHGQSASISKSNVDNADQDIQEELDPLIQREDILDKNQPEAY
ncbi:DUF4280 domain-containing protein [Bizionia paragorgiae]|uniref:DUF4280 domain-containing protein n=1 Tax=Bizionia paragorgiae TaxID=283786 RepID=A0A1H4AZ44_BIZPA|nr:DUF4280 domain-containing protein [Bizionia paragorgiae]SEA41150.1 protein of unknown function [Bizionia paragorgiae]